MKQTLSTTRTVFSKKGDKLFKDAGSFSMPNGYGL
jgi:hypothetical protein